MTLSAAAFPSSARSASAPAARRSRTRVQDGLLTASLTALAAFYLLPLAYVVGLSFLIPSPGVGNYVALLSNRTVHAVAQNTAIVTAITVALTTALAYATAYVMLKASPRARNVILACVLLPLWVSVLVRNYAWVAVLGSKGPINELLLEIGLIDEPIRLVRNGFGVIVGMVHYMLPYAILPIFAQMTRIDERAALVARSLGASPWQAFARVFLPLSRPGIAAAVFLTTIMSAGFYITPAVLGGGKTVMLAEFISIQISETLRWDIATALSTLMLLVTGAFVARYSHLLELAKAAPK